MELKDILNEYKDITQLMINKASSKEDISLLLEKRRDILRNIEVSNFDGEAIKKTIDELNIIQLESTLEKLIKDNMLEIKKEIKKVRQSKEAYKKYADFNGNALIFSTKR